jgi:hypothetical protein
MDFTKIDPAVLREFLKLSEARESLMEEVAAIDKQIVALSSGKLPRGPKADAAPASKLPGKRRGRKPGSKNSPKADTNGDSAPIAAKAPKAPRGPKAKSGKRGALKQQIIDLLTEAGPEGMAVRDISEKLGVKNQNVHVWFSTTGKKVAGISKVGEARYALAPEASPAPAPAPAPAPEPETAAA